MKGQLRISQAIMKFVELGGEDERCTRANWLLGAVSAELVAQVGVPAAIEALEELAHFIRKREAN